MAGPPSESFYHLPTILRHRLTSIQDHRMHNSRHSVSDFDPSRPSPAANMQNFYASQRFQGHPNHPGHPGRHEVDPTYQAKKRMAQARERDLRNYHQEQQYNRSESASSALARP
jgi:hypothetical protein